MCLRRHAAQSRLAERKIVRMNSLMVPMIALRVPRRAPVRRITVAQRPAGDLPATGTPMAAAVGSQYKCRSGLNQNRERSSHV
jgi:hypothetical protein